jgi:hypothetical protein
VALCRRKWRLQWATAAPHEAACRFSGAAEAGVLQWTTKLPN